jgi:hypothetical protein
VIAVGDIGPWSTGIGGAILKVCLTLSMIGGSVCMKRERCRCLASNGIADI